MSSQVSRNLRPCNDRSRLLPVSPGPGYRTDLFSSFCGNRVLTVFFTSSSSNASLLHRLYHHFCRLYIHYHTTETIRNNIVYTIVMNIIDNIVTLSSILSKLLPATMFSADTDDSIIEYQQCFFIRKGKGGKLVPRVMLPWPCM